MGSSCNCCEAGGPWGEPDLLLRLLPVLHSAATCGQLARPLLPDPQALNCFLVCRNPK